MMNEEALAMRVSCSCLTLVWLPHLPRGCFILRSLKCREFVGGYGFAESPCGLCRQGQETLGSQLSDSQGCRYLAARAEEVLGSAWRQVQVWRPAQSWPVANLKGKGKETVVMFHACTHVHACTRTYSFLGDLKPSPQGCLAPKPLGHLPGAGAPCSRPSLLLTASHCLPIFPQEERESPALSDPFPAGCWGPQVLLDRQPGL